MKTAMVWGAGGGIGKALVQRLMENDWEVVGVAREPGASAGVVSFSVAADVAHPEDVQQAVEQAQAAVGEVSLWIYAVGDIVSTRVSEISAEDWRRILDANLSGAFTAVQASLPLLSENVHMVFLGAVSERLHLPGLSAYAAAKAGLEALGDVLRKEQRGRRVTVVRPKAVDTDLWDKVPFSLPRGAMQPDELAERILAAHEEGHDGVLDV